MQHKANCAPGQEPAKRDAVPIRRSGRSELLVQIGRGRADDAAVDALGGVGLRTDLLRRESTRKEAFATSAGAGSGERTPGARVPKPGAGSGARPYRR